MKFYCYRGRPVAETLGHFVTWPTWPTKGGDWIEVSKTVLTEAIELSPGEWRKCFKPIETPASTSPCGIWGARWQPSVGPAGRSLSCPCGCRSARERTGRCC